MFAYIYDKYDVPQETEKCPSDEHSVSQKVEDPPLSYSLQILLFQLYLILPQAIL